ncbi:multiple epidermal growth factor-like domains protein 10 [Clytia hemisphaerica]|uniref:multiple epidermal growth factor-like domains protein 10 n=1 Tax=Clytia hemisphaerica TaxID=252671 RepID=UPI0034D784F2
MANLQLVFIFLCAVQHGVNSNCAPDFSDVVDNDFVENYAGKCSFSESKKVTIPVEVLTYKRCGFFWANKCYSKKTVYRQVYRAVVKNVNFQGKRCKNGYRMVYSIPDHGRLCVPDCSEKGCNLDNGGECGTPNNCTCTKPGFEGDDCGLACMDGYYGHYCQQKCQCKNDAVCNKTDGSCQCKPGFQGQYCQEKCVESWGQGCQRPATCVMNNTLLLDTVTGFCTCKKGFNGTNCEQSCPEKTFDQYCKQTCSCKNGAHCDPVDGTCDCTPGYRGHHCSLQCKKGKYGEHCGGNCECSSTNTHSCDHVTGECTCFPGFTGKECGQKCEEWTFGQNCATNCSCVRNNTFSCDSINGICNCTEGFNGEFCEKSCSSSNSTESCFKECNCTEGNGVCQRTTGQCLCHPGFHGKHCESQCPQGLFGMNCAQNCTCQNGANCSYIDGTCTCTAGYTGTKCDEPCTEGYYGPNCEKECPCGDHGDCDRFTGKCTCRGEYQGTYCDIMCKNETYGINCTEKCKCQTNTTEKCHAMTGECTCIKGWLPKKFCREKIKCLASEQPTAIIHMVAPKNGSTVDEYSKVFAAHVNSYFNDVNRVDVIFDIYLDSSLKEGVRETRGTAPSQIVKGATKISKWSKFLKNSSIKQRLFEYIAHYLKSQVTPSNTKQLVVTCRDMVMTNPISIGLGEIFSPCDHEEADTRMILHASNILEDMSSVTLRTVDTDVLVLAVAISNMYPTKKIWVSFGVGDQKKMFSAHGEIRIQVGPEKAQALPMFHAFTGCDRVSSFKNVGKKTEWERWAIV